MTDSEGSSGKFDADDWQDIFPITFVTWECLTGDSNEKFFIDDFLELCNVHFSCFVEEHGI